MIILVVPPPRQRLTSRTTRASALAFATSLHTIMLLCVGCSSTLSDCAGPSAPTNSEKPGPPILYYSCGHHALCSRCQVMHRRLAKVSATIDRSIPLLTGHLQGCIMCESVSDLMGGGDARASAKGGLPGYSESGRSRSTRQTMDEDSGDFVLGDDEDDEALPTADARASPPPSYEGGLAPLKDEKGREQVSLHYLRPEDTLNGLALKYGVEVSLLNRSMLSAELTFHSLCRITGPPIMSDEQATDVYALHHASLTPHPSVSPPSADRCFLLHRAHSSSRSRTTTPHCPTLPSQMQMRRLGNGTSLRRCGLH